MASPLSLTINITPKRWVGVRHRHPILSLRGELYDGLYAAASRQAIDFIGEIQTADCKPKADCKIRLQQGEAGAYMRAKRSAYVRIMTSPASALTNLLQNFFATVSIFLAPAAASCHIQCAPRMALTEETTL